MQKKSSHFFSFSSESTFATMLQRYEKSEQNAKEKVAFLFVFERKYLRNYVAEVRISEQRAY